MTAYLVLLKSLSRRLAHVNTPSKCPHYLFHMQIATKYDIKWFSCGGLRLIFDVGRLFAVLIIQYFNDFCLNAAHVAFEY
jgi:hypothetical protein